MQQKKFIYYNIVYILEFKLEYYKEVMESISCNGGDVFDFEILYETNISLNAKKSVNVKSISKTSPSSSNFRSSSSEKKEVFSIMQYFFRKKKLPRRQKKIDINIPLIKSFILKFSIRCSSSFSINSSTALVYAWKIKLYSVYIKINV